MPIPRNIAGIAAATLLLAACGGTKSGSGATNTTEVTPSDNVTTTDTMVTNIVPATPLAEETPGDNAADDTPPGNGE